ncbi:MAG TPA: DinB family protein [Luteitalea sp.]|nr:DinB family protein [Luteitalea sp.]
MTLSEVLTQQLDREVPRSRKALQQVPDDRSDWKPHDRSMAFGYLAFMVATIPSWLARMILDDSLDLAPKDGKKTEVPSFRTASEYLAALDKADAEMRAALSKASDDHLKTNWQLLVAGNVVQQASRFEMLTDTIAHWVHHRGQMTVYLRLMGATVPALYGPSADDKRF